MLLSGGIDSAFCLWQRAVAGLPTRTHHVVLADHEGRSEVEATATKRVLEYINQIGGKVEHTTSAVNFGGLRWIPKNYHLWAYWAGAIMASPKGQTINNVILPRHSDAFRGGPQGPSAQRSDTAYKGHVKLLCGRDPNLVFPIAHMTKADVIREMPAELLDRCWWCRTPRNGEACHKCITCKLVDPALEELGRAS